jgi:hypothetical protein
MPVWRHHLDPIQSLVRRQENRYQGDRTCRQRWEAPLPDDIANTGERFDDAAVQLNGATAVLCRIPVRKARSASCRSDFQQTFRFSS